MSSTRDNLTKEYATDEIVVEWEPRLCIHSGALRTRRLGASAPKRQQPLELRASANGPLLVSGGVRILDAEGTVLYEGEKAALCRCGGSGNKPFCDGTHEKNGFRG